MVDGGGWHCICQDAQGTRHVLSAPFAMKLSSEPYNVAGEVSDARSYRQWTADSPFRLYICCQNHPMRSLYEWKRASRQNDDGETFLKTRDRNVSESVKISASWKMMPTSQSKNGTSHTPWSKDVKHNGASQRGREGVDRESTFPFRCCRGRRLSLHHPRHAARKYVEETH